MAYKPIGTETISVGSTTPVGCSQNVKTGTAATLYVISVETNPIRWSDDPNFTLTSSAGSPLAVGATFNFDGDFHNLRFISQTGTASVTVAKYTGRPS